MQSASPRSGSLLGLIRARARCSPRGTSFGRSTQPRPPNSDGDGGPAYLRGGGFLPPRKCLGAPSPSTPLNNYTSTLLCGHPCRHCRSSIRLQAIHMHHREQLVSFPAHDDPSPVQYFGNEYRTKPRELQLRSTGSFQRYVVNPYQLSSLVFSPLDFTVVVIYLMCDESVNKERRDEGPERRNEGTNDRNEGTGNEKPYGLVQIVYRERGTRTRHMCTWGGRVNLYLDV